MLYSWMHFIITKYRNIIIYSLLIFSLSNSYHYSKLIFILFEQLCFLKLKISLHLSNLIQFKWYNSKLNNWFSFCSLKCYPIMLKQALLKCALLEHNCNTQWYYLLYYPTISKINNLIIWTTTLSLKHWQIVV